MLLVLAVPSCVDPPPYSGDETQVPPDAGVPPPWGDEFESGFPDPPAASAPEAGDSGDGDGDGDGQPRPGGDGDGDGDGHGPGGAADPGLDHLRITEFVSDPDGKDGALDGPEFMELLNTGPDTVALDALELEARSWPVLDAEALNLVGEALAPGQHLVVFRYDGESQPPAVLPGDNHGALTRAFETSSGLRNADGGLLVRNSRGGIADLVAYGGPQPAPFDAVEAWTGIPIDAPAAGLSACREDPNVDGDDASDWSSCTPTPGHQDPGPGDGDGDGDGDGGLDHDLPTESPDVPDDPGDAFPPGEAPIAIVEVLANAPGPSAEEKHHEFIEIENYGEVEVELAGWRIADDLAADAPGIDPLSVAGGDGGCAVALCLAPGRRALIVGNQYEGPVGDALVLHTDDSTIADAGLTSAEPAVLRDASEAIVSTYRDWADPLADPNPIATELPLHRAQPLAEDEPPSWEFGEPSPGD